MTTSVNTTAQGGRLGRSIAAVALSTVALASTVTGALFTDTDTAGANTFATGNVELTTTPTTAAITMSTMAPGDVTHGNFTVQNSGSLQLRYALSSSTTEDQLAGQLVLTVWDEAAESDADTTCSTTTVPATTLYSGVLGTVAGTSVFGATTAGFQTGDRTLGANASELLCMKAELPRATGNTFEGLTTTATFTFDSEQTANNA